MIARPGGSRAWLQLGQGLLGRVIDGFGKHPGRQGPAQADPRDRTTCIERPPESRWTANTSPSRSSRASAPSRPATCGKGQRIGIFGGSGVGKSTLLGAMARHSSADVSVIALIGERNREVRAFIEHELGPEGLAKSSSWSPLPTVRRRLRVRACFVALAVAEYFRDQGKSVLLGDGFGHAPGDGSAGNRPGRR